MRQVHLGKTGISASCLGFGCASLGSRIDADTGLRAMEAAFEAGVSWFDLAPVYGGGRAEEIAAPFLAAHRDKVQICTKAGLGLAGGAGGGLRQAVMPLARKILAHAGPLGARLRKAAPKANTRLPLSPEMLKASLESSLRRIGTDYVDLFALHDPAPEDLSRDDIARALEDIVSSGRARAVAVAGSAEAARVAVETGAPFGAVQMALPEPGGDADVLSAAAEAGFGTLTHSVFGLGGARDALRARMAADPDFTARILAAAGGGDADAALSQLLMARAFALNPDGVIPVSMFSDASRTANLAAAARPVERADPLVALGV